MFSIFYNKKNLIGSGLPENMTDIHSHLLPGVDDGVKTEQESLYLLEKLASYGIKRLFITPHVMIEYTENTEEHLTALFENLQKKCPAGIKIRLAAEYMLDEGFMKHLNHQLLTYDGRRVLVETSFQGCSMQMVQKLLYEISLRNYIPVLAHPERYTFMSREDYKLLIDCGCEFQLNIASLSGRYGKKVMDKARSMLDNYIYNYAASDIHGQRHLGIYDSNKLNNKELKKLKLLLANNANLWDKKA